MTDTYLTRHVRDVACRTRARRMSVALCQIDLEPIEERLQIAEARYRYWYPPALLSSRGPHLLVQNPPEARSVQFSLEGQGGAEYPERSAAALDRDRAVVLHASRPYDDLRDALNSIPNTADLHGSDPLAPRHQCDTN